jgi:hypothetical protein
MKEKSHSMVSLVAVAISLLCVGPAHAQNAIAVPFQIMDATIDDIHMAFRSGKLTARQLVQSYLDRINAYDKQGPNINSIITINPNALAEADRLDAAFRTSGLVGPLHGITILVKDEIDTGTRRAGGRDALPHWSSAKRVTSANPETHWWTARGFILTKLTQPIIRAVMITVMGA